MTTRCKVCMSHGARCMSWETVILCALKSLLVGGVERIKPDVWCIQFWGIPGYHSGNHLTTLLPKHRPSPGFSLGWGGGAFGEGVLTIMTCVRIQSGTSSTPGFSFERTRDSTPCTFQHKYTSTKRPHPEPKADSACLQEPPGAGHW